MQLFFFLKYFKIFPLLSNKLTCCSPQGKTSSVVYYLSPFKSLFFGPGAERRDNTEGITTRSEGPPKIGVCCLVLFVCLLIDLCVCLCLRLDLQVT